jgi:hydroxyquinol 1,2-dioxygenase
VWQANGDGLYENQEPDLQPEFNLRGRYRSGADGGLMIRSVRPAGYPIPADGPVGRLLTRLGIGLMRPAHVHFRITAAGFQRLTTHVFDGADPALGADPLFAVHPALVADIAPAPAGGWRMEYRFVLARARAGEDG